MRYATVEEVEAGFRDLTDTEKQQCEAMLEEAAIIIDVYNQKAVEDIKTLVSCRMVRRQLGDGSGASAFPMGASQGSVSALGYSQSWTLSSGSTGELYLSKQEKKLLGLGDRIGASGPLEKLCEEYLSSYT